MTNFIEAEITAQVAALCKWISEGSVTQVEMEMSLTRDLAFDSMKIMQFFAGIEDFYPGIALEDWFIENSSGGRDTIGSVVGYVARVLTPMAAE
jgi:acyl carrier protein